jgi:hypothetical protein
MVLCSESNTLEVVNTDDIIKGFASPKKEKFFYINNIYIFVLKKKKKRKYIFKLKYIFFCL